MTPLLLAHPLLVRAVILIAAIALSCLLLGLVAYGMVVLGRRIVGAFSGAIARRRASRQPAPAAALESSIVLQ